MPNDWHWFGIHAIQLLMYSEKRPTLSSNFQSGYYDEGNRTSLKVDRQFYSLNSKRSWDSSIVLNPQFMDPNLSDIFICPKSASKQIWSICFIIFNNNNRVFILCQSISYTKLKLLESYSRGEFGWRNRIQTCSNGFIKDRPSHQIGSGIHRSRQLAAGALWNECPA